MTVHLCFTPNRKLLILSVLLLPVLMSLGGWQLGRAEQKREILAELKARSAMPPVLITDLMDKKNIRYRAVRMFGAFDNGHSFLLDNRVKNGAVGYDVLTPFVESGGQIVLVNRGWVAAPPYRDQLPVVSPVHGNIALTGTIYQPLAEVEPVAENSSGWPRVIQSLNFTEMASSLEKSLPALTVRLHEGVTGSLETGWPTVNVQPEKHTAYAVQWYVMALALFVLTVVANVKFVRRNLNKSNNDKGVV